MMRASRAVLGCAGVALLLAWIAPAAWAGSAREVLDRANELYSRGRFEDALSAYREGLLQFPDVPELHHGAGDALYRLKRYAEAEQEFAEASRLGGGGASRYNEGDAKVRETQLEGSLESYRQALRAHPEDPDAKFNYELVKGRILQQKQQNQQDKQGGKPRPDPQKKQGGGNQKLPQPGDKDKNQGGQRPQKDPQELNKDQASQILKALESDEQRVQNERLKARVVGRPPGKDW